MKESMLLNEELLTGDIALPQEAMMEHGSALNPGWLLGMRSNSIAIDSTVDSSLVRQQAAVGSPAQVLLLTQACDIPVKCTSKLTLALTVICVFLVYFSAGYKGF